MRISTSQIYSQSLKYINSSLSDVSELNMINSSQKQINSPSDDPTGMGKCVELRAYEQSLSGYIDNCDIATDYLDLADETLSQVSEVLTAASELLEQAATETYTDTELLMMADELEGYLDSLQTLASAKMGTDAVFAGNALDSDIYETGLSFTLTTDVLSNGSISSLSGDAEDPIYVQFTSDGTVGTDELTYQYSTDGGTTWTEGTLAAGDTELDLGDCQVDMTTGTAVTAADGDEDGSEFVVRESLYYVGSDTAMTVAVSESNEVDMTTVGSDIFGGLDSTDGTAYEDPNLFEIISDAIAYMTIGDNDAVADSLEDLREAHEHVEAAAAKIGARENKVEYIEESLSMVQTIATNSISREEDADAAQILVELEQANYVYEAVLESSSSIMQMSILNYI